MTIQALLNELDERTIARRIGIPNDEERIRFRLNSNTVRDFDEFEMIIGSYYNQHFTACVSRGGRLSNADARGRAKEILEKEYRRRGGDIVMAFNDAADGTNSGLRGILDVISESIKAESVALYIRDAFDRHVRPHSWEQQLDIIRQFINHCGSFLSSSIDRRTPERYARNYKELISSYVNALQKTSGIFRRL